MLLQSVWFAHQEKKQNCVHVENKVFVNVAAMLGYAFISATRWLHVLRINYKCLHYIFIELLLLCKSEQGPDFKDRVRHWNDASMKAHCMI